MPQLFHIIELLLLAGAAGLALPAPRCLAPLRGAEDDERCGGGGGCGRERRVRGRGGGRGGGRRGGGRAAEQPRLSEAEDQGAREGAGLARRGDGHGAGAGGRDARSGRTSAIACRPTTTTSRR